MTFIAIGALRAKFLREQSDVCTYCLQCILADAKAGGARNQSWDPWVVGNTVDEGFIHYTTAAPRGRMVLQ